MSLPHILMWATVLAVGVPAAWRNATAGALVLCWVFSEGLYALTGNGLAVDYYIFPDILVLAVIASKPRRYPCEHYANAWHQLKCLLLERSRPDRFIICTYPLVWACYVAEVDAYYKWWALYWLAMVQFFAAAAEPLSDYINRRRNADAADPPVQGFMLVAYPGGAAVG